MFTKELGVNNRAIPGVNVVYSDSSSRVRHLQTTVLRKDRLTHKGSTLCPDNSCGRYSGLRPPNKSVHASDLARQVRNMRHSGSRPPKRI
jgi:hypothetical protein